MVENYNIRLPAGFGAGAANAGSIGNGRIMAKQLIRAMMIKIFKLLEPGLSIPIICRQMADGEGRAQKGQYF